MSWLSVNWLIAATDEPVVRLTPQARIVAAILAVGFMLLILDLIRRDLDDLKTRDYLQPYFPD